MKPHWLEWFPSWIEALTSSAAIIAVVLTARHYFISGFVIRGKARIDSADKRIRVDLFNWGRLAGAVEECVVVRKDRWFREPRIEEVQIAEFYDGDFTRILLPPSESMRLTIRRTDNTPFPQRKQLRVRLLLGPGERREYRIAKSKAGEFSDSDGWLPGTAGKATEQFGNEGATEVDRLRDAADMKQDGLLSESEFERVKRAILARMGER